MEPKMQPGTIAYFVRNRQICLAPKMRGFGTGKLNGYGGKFNEGETLAQVLRREVLEESGVAIDLKDCEQVASIKFYLKGVPAFHNEIFLIRDWLGEPREVPGENGKSEMGQPEWYDFDKLPLERMWVSDSRWLTKVLSGEKLRAEIDFSEEEREIYRFEFEPAEFEPLEGPGTEVRIH